MYSVHCRVEVSYFTYTCDVGTWLIARSPPHLRGFPRLYWYRSTDLWLVCTRAPSVCTCLAHTSEWPLYPPSASMQPLYKNHKHNIESNLICKAHTESSQLNTSASIMRCPQLIRTWKFLSWNSIMANLLSYWMPWGNDMHECIHVAHSYM